MDEPPMRGGGDAMRSADEYARRVDWDVATQGREVRRLLEGAGVPEEAVPGLADRIDWVYRPALEADMERSQLLQELAMLSPASLDADEYSVCWFCGRVMEEYYQQPEIPHAEDCLWGRIREAVGLPVPPASPARLGGDEEESADAA